MQTETAVLSYQGRVLADLSIEELRDAEGLTISRVLEHEDNLDRLNEKLKKPVSVFTQNNIYNSLQTVWASKDKDQKLLDVLREEIDLRNKITYLTD